MPNHHKSPPSQLSEPEPDYNDNVSYQAPPSSIPDSKVSPPPQAQSAPQPAQAPKSMTMEEKAFEIINGVVNEVKSLDHQVNTFNGKKKDKQYLYLEEMMTRFLLKLDSVEAGSHENIRQARKQIVKLIENALNLLELKGSTDGKDPSRVREMQSLRPLTPSNPILDVQDLDHQFGKAFCTWFFNMLNHPDPMSQGFGPSHFLPMAQMFLQYGNISNNYYSNQIDISNCLLDLSRNARFLPNVAPDGMKVKSDYHGLKVKFILVCGTLFSKGLNFGDTFEQSFVLVKSPTVPDNWIIQVTALKCSEDCGCVDPGLDDLSVERLAIEFLDLKLKEKIST